MKTILDIVFPVFFLILLGYITSRYKFLPQETGHILSNFLFNVSLPCLAFVNIAPMRPSEIFNLRFFLAFAITSYLMNLILFFILHYGFHKSREELALLMMGGSYTNSTYIGFPVINLIFSTVTPAVMVLFFQSVFLFPVTLFLLDYFQSGNKKISIASFFKIILKNPIIMAYIISVIFSFSRIQIPEFMLKPFSMLGSTCSAIGLFALGFTLHHAEKATLSKDNIKTAIVCSINKIIFMPLLGWTIGKYLFHLDSWWLSALTVISMLPTAVNLFVTSQRYRICEVESHWIVIMTTLGFSITISGYILLAGI